MSTHARPSFNAQLAEVPDTLVESEAMLTAPAGAMLNGLGPGQQAVMPAKDYAGPMVSLQYFQSALLPPLRPGLDVADIVNRLVRAGHIQAYKDTHWHVPRWTSFSTEPSHSGATENIVFKNFERVATAVHEISQTALREWMKAQPVAKPPALIDIRPTTIIACNSEMIPFSNLRSKTSKPDSFARLNPATPFAWPGSVSKEDRILWDDIVVPGEFKNYDVWHQINDVSVCVF